MAYEMMGGEISSQQLDRDQSITEQEANKDAITTLHTRTGYPDEHAQTRSDPRSQASLVSDHSSKVSSLQTLTRSTPTSSPAFPIQPLWLNKHENQS